MPPPCAGRASSGPAEDEARIRITFVGSDGGVRAVDGAGHDTLMEAARMSGVPGIDANCGGSGACATCHVYVDAQWWNRLDGPDEMEAAMLDSVCERRATSRLSCQIAMDERLDGLIVEVPAMQG